MRKILFLLFASAILQSAQAQIIPLVITDDLEVIDTGNITREQWRDSLLRMDMSLVHMSLLPEYFLFGLAAKSTHFHHPPGSTIHGAKYLKNTTYRLCRW